MYQTITDKEYKANQNAKNLPSCLFKTQKNINFCPYFLEMSLLHCGWHQPWKFSVHPVQDTPDVTFLSLLRKHPTSQWPNLMVFRWYQGSKGVLSAQDPNETWAEIVAWRPYDLFLMLSHNSSNHCHWQHSIGLFPTVLVASLFYCPAACRPKGG